MARTPASLLRRLRVLRASEEALREARAAYRRSRSALRRRRLADAEAAVEAARRAVETWTPRPPPEQRRFDRTARRITVRVERERASREREVDRLRDRLERALATVTERKSLAGKASAEQKVDLLRHLIELREQRGAPTVERWLQVAEDTAQADRLYVSALRRIRARKIPKEEADRLAEIALAEARERVYPGVIAEAEEAWKEQHEKVLTYQERKERQQRAQKQELLLLERQGLPEDDLARMRAAMWEASVRREYGKGRMPPEEYTDRLRRIQTTYVREGIDRGWVDAEAGKAEIAAIRSRTYAPPADHQPLHVGVLSGDRPGELLRAPVAVANWIDKWEAVPKLSQISAPDIDVRGVDRVTGVTRTFRLPGDVSEAIKEATTIREKNLILGQAVARLIVRFGLAPDVEVGTWTFYYT